MFAEASRYASGTPMGCVPQAKFTENRLMIDGKHRVARTKRFSGTLRLGLRFLYRHRRVLV